MLFTAGVGTSIVILGFLEPIYYVSAPPFDLEPFSKAAYEYAHMYGQFHWGFSAWAFYNPAIIAIAYVRYVRKENIREVFGQHQRCTGIYFYGTDSFDRTDNADF